jgi:hypothetical protein
MVVNALGPALLALLALIALASGLSGPLLFRGLSAVYLVAAVYFGLLSVRQQRELSAGGQLVFTGSLNAAVWAGSLLAHAIQLVNLLGFPAGPSLGVFLLGLWVLLVVAGVQFVALLFLVLR